MLHTNKIIVAQNLDLEFLLSKPSCVKSSLVDNKAAVVRGKWTAAGNDSHRISRLGCLKQAYKKLFKTQLKKHCFLFTLLLMSMRVRKNFFHDGAHLWDYNWELNELKNSRFYPKNLTINFVFFCDCCKTLNFVFKNFETLSSFVGKLLDEN